MNLKYDFSGRATRNDLICADGRTICHNAFEDCDRKTIPLVWSHQYDEPGNILGHALLENREDGAYAYCTLSETDAGKAVRMLVQHGDIVSLSIYANGLKQTPGKDVMHGVIREVSLVAAGINPGVFIGFVDMAHGEGGEQEMTLSAYESISLFRSNEKPPLVHKAGSEDGKKGDKPKGDGKEEKLEDEKTAQGVVDSMTEEQRTVIYALTGAAMEKLDPQKGKRDGGGDDDDDSDRKSDKTKGGNKTMKYNVFENEDTQDTALSHPDRADILALAGGNSVGSLQTALKIYAERSELEHSVDNIESLFPDFKDLRPSTPERVTRDQGRVTAVMQRVHKSPIGRIRTRQMNTRKDFTRAHGYQKGTRKILSGNMNVTTRITGPQTVYRTGVLHRGDIVDTTDLDVVEYQYAMMRGNLNKEVATVIMVGDGHETDDEMKISEDHICSIRNDNDLYTIHYDADIEAARAGLNGNKTDMSLSENYIYSEVIIIVALCAREKYKGTGTLDFLYTPHLVNVMLPARDMSGCRIYNSRADLAAALSIGELHTAEQFEGLVRMDDEGVKHKLLDLFANLANYTVDSTKGGEITRFDQFNIDFNQQKYLIETRLSGTLTRVYSAIAPGEPVVTSSGGGSNTSTP